MPSDIKISWDSGLMEGDFVFDSLLQDFDQDEEFQTAVLISLFSDRRANDDDVLPDPESSDRRGWWGDLAAPIIEGDQIGSKLWLLNREKTLPTVLQKAKQYAREALQWMIDDGVALTIDVEAWRQGIVGNDLLAIQIRIKTIEKTEYVFLESSFESIYVSSVTFGGQAVTFGGGPVSFGGV